MSMETTLTNLRRHRDALEAANDFSALKVAMIAVVDTLIMERTDIEEAAEAAFARPNV